MKTQEIVDLYKTMCPDLEDVSMMLPKDYQEITHLQLQINKGEITEDDLRKAFKMANSSNYLTGQVNGWTASIGWMCNIVNLKKVLSGKYNRTENKPRRVKASFDYSGEKEKELELEQHQKNMAKLEKIRNDKDHQEWLEKEWYKKHPNMKGA